MSSSKFFIICFFIFCANAAHAEIYEWTNENGQTIYGDKPISSNANKIEIRKISKNNSAVQEAQKRNAKQIKLLNVMQQERDEREALRKKEKEKRDEQKKLCADARKKLKKIEEGRFLYRDKDDQDNPIILTDEERTTEEVTVKNYIKENC